MFFGDMHSFGGWLWVILYTLFYGAIFVGVFVFIIWAVRQLVSKKPEKSQSGAETPVAILKARYARGEITREEYLQILADLKEEG